MKNQSPFPPPCWKHFTGISMQLQAAQQLQTHNPEKREAGLGARPWGSQRPGPSPHLWDSCHASYVSHTAKNSHFIAILLRLLALRNVL